MQEGGSGGPFDPLVGTIIGGRYEILRRLGEGGMGSVYAARHVHIDRVDAVKVISPELLASDRNAIERFRRGSSNLSQINHENVCRVYDLAQTADGRWFLPMEYVDGQSLEDLISGEGPLEVWRALAFATQIARGLHAAHEAGVVHRDLKPANVMVTTMGGREIVKIVDFDIAKGEDRGAEMTELADRVGTPAYMSPEQFAGDPLDARSDLYALGLAIFKMLTGRLPLRGHSKMEIYTERLQGEPLKLDDVSDRSDLPDSVQPLLDRLLARVPNDRYATAAEVAGVLQGLHRWEGGVDRRSRSREGPEPTIPMRLGRDVSAGPDRTEPATTVVEKGGTPPKDRSGGRSRWLVAIGLAGVGALVAATVLIVGNVGPPQIDLAEPPGRGPVVQPPDTGSPPANGEGNGDPGGGPNRQGGGGPGQGEGPDQPPPVPRPEMTPEEKIEAYLQAHRDAIREGGVEAAVLTLLATPTGLPDASTDRAYVSATAEWSSIAQSGSDEVRRSVIRLATRIAGRTDLGFMKRADAVRAGLGTLQDLGNPSTLMAEKRELCSASRGLESQMRESGADGVALIGRFNSSPVYCGVE